MGKRHRVITCNSNDTVSVMTDWLTRYKCRQFIIGRWGHWPPFAFITPIRSIEEIERKYLRYKRGITMKMKRGSFKVNMFDNEKRKGYFEERGGLYSRFFGIHRNENNEGYKVTHLPTGRAVTTMETQKQARRLVEELEGKEGELPVSWTNEDPDAFTPNGEEVWKIIHKVREEG